MQWAALSLSLRGVKLVTFDEGIAVSAECRRHDKRSPAETSTRRCRRGRTPRWAHSAAAGRKGTCRFCALADAVGTKELERNLLLTAIIYQVPDVPEEVLEGKTYICILARHP